MKKEYNKPELELISFSEDIMAGDEASTTVGDGLDD